MRHFLTALCCAILIAGCASKIKKFERAKELEANEEFDRAVKIVSEEPDEDPSVASAGQSGAGGTGAVTGAGTAAGKDAGKSGKTKSKDAAKKPAKPEPKTKNAKKSGPVDPLKHEPADVEDGHGFVGRRPIVDPFRVGESVVHNVSYEIGYAYVSAGELTMKVAPFVQVNGRKSYNFVMQIATYPRFSSMVHAVDDKVVTFVDHELMIPRVFTMHVKESNLVKEARSFFDFENLTASYWEKKVTERDGIEEKKKQWEILPYTQNVFSALFYMRTFAWEDGKTYAFRVSDDTENLTFSGKVVGRETLKTDLGPMKAIKIKPDIILKGKFKPVGDIFIWLSDDDRKLVLRIESKIKIGSLVSQVVRIQKGREP